MKYIFLLITLLILSQVITFLIFSTIWFVYSEINGYSISYEPNDLIRRLELIGSVITLSSFCGLMIGYVSALGYSLDRKLKNL